MLANSWSHEFQPNEASLKSLAFSIFCQDLVFRYP